MPFSVENLHEKNRQETVWSLKRLQPFPGVNFHHIASSYWHFSHQWPPYHPSYSPNSSSCSPCLTQASIAEVSSCSCCGSRPLSVTKVPGLGGGGPCGSGTPGRTGGGGPCGSGTPGCSGWLADASPREPAGWGSRPFAAFLGSLTGPGRRLFFFTSDWNEKKNNV